MSAPVDLIAVSGDGKQKVLVAAGSPLPARGELMFGTSKPGQAELLLELREGPEARLVARAKFELPRGLPANCWLPVEVRLSADLKVQAEARENLRRLRIDARFDVEGADAEHYGV